MDDKRLPNCAKIAIGMQACITCIVFIMWFAWTTWGRLPYSLEASSVIFGPVMLLGVIATLGLWKGKMYGWVTGLIENAAMGLILFFTAGPFCILPMAFLVYLLIPSVREFYVQDYYE